MKISGIVRDRQTSRVIQGAQVEIWAPGRQFARLVTDQAGAFAHEEDMRRYSDVELTITITKENYESSSVCVPLQGDALSLDVALTSEDGRRGSQLLANRDAGRARSMFLSVMGFAVFVTVGVLLFFYFEDAMSYFRDLEGVWPLRDSSVAAEPDCTAAAYRAFVATQPSAEAAFTRAEECLEAAAKKADQSGIAQATYLLRWASDRGHAGAALKIAQLYDPKDLDPARSRQLPPETNLAIAWYRTADDRGSTEAEEALERLRK